MLFKGRMTFYFMFQFRVYRATSGTILEWVELDQGGCIRLLPVEIIYMTIIQSLGDICILSYEIIGKNFIQASPLPDLDLVDFVRTESLGADLLAGRSRKDGGIIGH